MKNILLVAFATSFALTPIGLQAQDDDIVVTSARSIDRFVNDVSQDLNHTLNRNNRGSNQLTGTGIVQISFECGPDGKPTNIVYYRKDDDYDVNRLARSAVKKIRSMHPLPRGISEDQKYLANMIMARDPWEYKALSEELSRSEQARIAASKGKPTFFAFKLAQPPVHLK